MTIPLTLLILHAQAMCGADLVHRLMCRLGALYDEDISGRHVTLRHTCHTLDQAALAAPHQIQDICCTLTDALTSWHPWAVTQHLTLHYTTLGQV